MDVVVRGRHEEVPERFRRHAAAKLERVLKLAPTATRVDVEVCRETNPRLSDVCHRVELTCRARGPVTRAEAAAADPYAALDAALDRLEARLRKVADRRRVHHGHRTPESLAAATARAAQVNGQVPDEEPEPAPDAPFVVREKVHRADPMSLDQALHEMELVGHDFYLFVDATSGLPCVIYRRRGYDYGLIRLEAGGVPATPPGAIDGDRLPD